LPTIAAASSSDPPSSSSSLPIVAAVAVGSVLIAALIFRFAVRRR
jgi:high-affinity Fe2+/Pb2+ permease